MKKYLHFLTLSFFLFILSPDLLAQTNKTDMLERINDYKSLEKEKVYLHLNRSLLLKGDKLGFTAYLVNEIDHAPVTSDPNLYLTITNAKNEVIIREMYPVESGIATGIIEIDSTYNSGQYTITAYTRYMKEFEEPYHFTENFQVIEATSPELVANERQDKIDAQFLPESGHFLSGAINNVGIIVKNQLGYGISNGKIMIRSDAGEIISVINLNEFGIGKFAFLHEPGKNYFAELEYDNKKFPLEFKPALKREGIIFSTTEKDSQLEILVKTNDYTLNNLSPNLSLIIQGKETLYNFDIEFKEHKNIAVRVPLQDLDPGINIITIFDDKRQPVAERLVFNFENYNHLTPQNVQKRVIGDSLNINIPFQEDIEGSLSISILPQNTLSYNRNHNIISHLLLKPYLKGNIENGGWYFTEISDRKKEELDKLLLTQGWSSYNWKKVFNAETDKIVNYQDNFAIQAKIPVKDQNRKNLRYMLHGSGDNGPQVIEIPYGADSFIFEGFLPVGGEDLRISRIESDNVLVPANLSVTFLPNRLPDAPNSQNTLSHFVRVEKKDLSRNIYNYELMNKDAVLLEEVMVFGKTAAQAVKDRERDLGNHRWGKVNVITPDDVRNFITLADFLRTKNINVLNSPNGFRATTNLATSSKMEMGVGAGVEPIATNAPVTNAGGMLFYLDDILITDTNMFYNFSMMHIDFLEINKWGMGSGLMGEDGSIKIYTKKGSHLADPNRIQVVNIPITYAASKKFYVPKYVSTSNSFFQEFGVIDWKPKIRFDLNNSASINIKNPEVDFQLIIEGVTKEGELIHSVQKLSPGSN